ncbi:MAG: hypothetical protein ACREKL_12955 [Chthoniobacterales bacterium]
MKNFSALLFVAAAVSCLSAAHAGDAIQIDTSSVFNNRPVTTVVDGKLAPMTGDVDAAGGVITHGAAKLMGSEDPHALPDDGKFPANAKHALIILPYATGDANSKQARKSRGEDTFSFSVPPKKYSKLWLMTTSGQGPTTINVEMTYADKTSQAHTLEVPDWYWELKPTDPYRCYVASDLSKWGPKKQLEKDHHFIFGLDIQPDPTKTLEKVTVTKTKKGILGFFGATGEASNP